MGAIYSSIKNRKVELIFNETFELLQRAASVTFTLPERAGSWNIKFQFLELKTDIEYSANVEVDDNGISYTFFHWNAGDTNVFNPEPYYHYSDDKSIEIYIKVRTLADESFDTRNVHVSVWQVIKSKL